MRVADNESGMWANDLDVPWYKLSFSGDFMFVCISRNVITYPHILTETDSQNSLCLNTFVTYYHEHRLPAQRSVSFT